MSRNTLAMVVAALLIVSAAGIALAAGFGPDSGNDSGSEITDFPTATPGGDGAGDGSSSGGGSGDSSGGSDGGNTSTAAPTGPFALDVKKIEKCGTTCRDVTITLTNQQDEQASNVVVYTRIFAGNSTDPDDQVWSGKEQVGTLDAGEQYSATKRVKLSFSEGYAVKQNDGWITVQTTIKTDEQTITFSERRNVN